MFAVMIFAAVLMAVTAAINAAIGVSYKGALISLGRVWGKSLLGEYDLFLKDRYGILGFYSNDYMAVEKLGFYADYSFSDKSYVHIESIKADTENYSLADIENLRQQIEDACLYGAEPKSYKLTSPGGGNVTAAGHESGAGTGVSSAGDRYISSLWIERGLPSYGKTKKLYLTELVERIKSGFSADSIIGQLASDRYIFKFFKNYTDDKGLGDTYFNCEAEYIISGKLSDSGAAKDVRSKIKTMRNLLNLYYLYSCAEKRQAVLSLAQLITPGPAAFATQAVMMETWAYLEAENDINILYSGETVPLLKKDRNWALSLENVFDQDGQEKEAAGNYVRPAAAEGEDYEDYIGVLLFGLTEETKLLRIADLIQINGKYLYCDSFLMKDYCTGLEYGIKVNGYEKSFEEHY